MKALLSFSLLLLAVILMAFSCSTPGDVSPQLPLTFSYTLLNASGDSTLTFSEGEEISFRFKIKNDTEEPIILYNFLRDLLGTDGAFYVEQKISMEPDSESKWIRVGRACTPYYITDIGGIGISAHSFYEIKFKWFDTLSGSCEKANPPLNKGNYRSSFTCKFTGNGGTYAGVSTTQTFNVQFTVK
ncbi:hypothetical protein [Umezakia ovalisporum]|uniref:Lipoprotein n=1 Tax=Umezakia ovalisporum FSS-43 TaxID=2740520 RepID=A0ABT6K3E5_9CYAN|nr:hypothetical protein [Umezakia ovalisporum]MDH6056863.1 hypothetical protein [Umezakia ovalisporum FSS-43]